LTGVRAAARCAHALDQRTVRRGNDAGGSVGAKDDRRPVGHDLARAHSRVGDICILANGMSVPLIERREA
jgi:hypothetical protein